MRVLGNPDIMLGTDLVLLQSAGLRGMPATAPGLTGFASRWAPWRSYAALHLWRARQWSPSDNDQPEPESAA
jgi:AraC family transcriptional regulator of adaptative response / DNA-3-methyladenine glycosylase II